MLFACVAAGAACGLSGCYQRVVSASGPAYSGTDIEEPYQEAWPITPIVRGLESSGSQRPTERKRGGGTVFGGATDR